MSKALAFIGYPINFKDKFKIYPPTIREIITTEEFLLYRHILTMSAYDIQDQIKKEDGDGAVIPSPFEFLLINCFHNKSFEQLAKRAIKFFIHQEVVFLYEQKIIVVGSMQEVLSSLEHSLTLITITDEEFFDFQNAIRESIGEKQLAPMKYEEEENPVIARIKAKARERDRIKAKQQSKNGISLETTLTAICCMGIGITPLNIGEMSYAAISPIMNMMQEKEKYDIDIRSLLAGADSKKIKPKYWIRNNEKD